MTETMDQPVQPEAQAESAVATKFQQARDRVMEESAELNAIYKSMTKPSGKDVYQAWVRNMDTVANSYSWGRDKAGFRTNLLKVTNRIVGVGAVALTVPGDLVIDVCTWPLRKFPIVRIVGGLIPTNMLKRHTVYASEVARNEAMVLRGVGKVVDAPAEIGQAAIGSAIGGFAEVRAPLTYVGRKVSQITESILHPKPKA